MSDDITQLQANLCVMSKFKVGQTKLVGSVDSVV